jgi:hypothetical protein
LTKIASGSTVTISEDLSWDGASASDTDDTGDVTDVNIETVAGGTLTLNVKADEDLITHADTTFANVTDLTGAAVININSSNSDSFDIINDLTATGLDNTQTRTLTATAGDSAGLDLGNITNAAALESLTFSSAAGAASTIGTMITATGLSTLALSSTGSASSMTTGAIGGTAAAKLESLTATSASGSTTIVGAITSTSSSALTAIEFSATGASSIVDINGAMNFGTATVAAMTLKADTNATLRWAAASTTTGTVTAGTFQFADYSTLSDNAGGNNDLTITSAFTTLGVSLGRGITNTAGDSIVLSGAITTLNLSSALGAEAVALATNNDLSYGGNELIQMGTITKANYTHSGTGSLSWVGDNIGAAVADTQVIKSNATSTTADTLEGGAGNDSLTGNAGANLMEGNAGNDTISGLAGNDTITGSAGNDVLTGGDGDDTVDGGVGNDSINITESTPGADLVQLTNTVAAITTVGTGSGDDTGADTVTGFDTANDTLRITATGVVSFVHATDTGFGSAGDVATNGIASTTNVTVNELAASAFYFDFDTAANVHMSTAAVDMVVNMPSLKTSGVAYTATSDAAMEATLQYNLTGTAAANTITTSGKADTIDGGGGADTIDGGAGADAITGGTGVDVYMISTNNGADTYTAKINEDLFDLTHAGNVISGTYAEAAITNDGGTTLTTKTLTGTNTTLYVIDTDATQLGTNIAAAITDFTSMTAVAAFLELGDGFVSANSLGKIDYFLINDGSDTTKAYLYKFVDGAGNTTLAAAELSLIASITTQAGAMDVNEFQ